MSQFKAITRAFWQSFQATFIGRHFPITSATAWDSMVLAASEEWGDEKVFRFEVTLPQEVSYSDLAKSIVEEAISHPDLYALVQDISTNFRISKKDALTAIDRSLGGICRAAALWPGASPDPKIDPVAAAAFALAAEDHSILDAVYPGWTDWKPGPHSKPNRPGQS